MPKPDTAAIAPDSTATTNTMARNVMLPSPSAAVWSTAPGGTMFAGPGPLSRMPLFAYWR
jgi:hypothetical protein